MNDRIPAQAFPPGEFLRDELESRGWSQVELSEILGRPPRVISEIVSGKRTITPETAKGLAAAFGCSAELWMNLEASYQLSKARLETSAVVRRARLYGKFPVKEMIRRRWVKAATDVSALEREFCAFFAINSIEESPIFVHAAKKRHYEDIPQTLQLAWLNRAEQIAKQVKVGAYTTALLREEINELRSSLESIDGVKKVARILNRAAVRFVIVEYLPRAKLDGACFWLDTGKSPVIALSLRLDRIDNFWHTLFHEIDHVLHGEGKQTPVIDILESGEAPNNQLPREEVRANHAAAGYCIDQGVLEKWIAQTSRIWSRENIVEFAKRLRVHPGILVGQLQHRGIMPYSYHREFLERVRSLVIAIAPTDGFGTN